VWHVEASTFYILPNVTVNDQSPPSPLTALVVIRVAAYSLIVAAVLFDLSGRLDWTMAWIYLGVLTISTRIAPGARIILGLHPGRPDSGDRGCSRGT